MKTTPSSALARAHAARGIAQVTTQNRTIDWVLQEKPQWCETPMERELIFGTIRHYPSLLKRVETRLAKPLRNKDQDLMMLLLVGAYQLKYTNIPQHAIINETVQGAIELRKPWAKGLVNGVLRSLARAAGDGEHAHQDADQSFDHPFWLASRVRTQYPDNWTHLLAANNTRAPMVLRINTRKINRDAYAAKLKDADIAFDLGLTPASLVLREPQPSAGLPGWAEGEVTVQDMGAQFAAGLLHPGADPAAPADLRVLDACAAPGGKLAHLVEELTPGTPLLGIDISAARIEQTQQILHRLGHRVTLQCADANTLAWWDGDAFSHILLDAPCSGTGTIRRHPDIKILLREQAIEQHAALQLHILNNLWQTLAAGGNLLYCTCSLLRAENDDVVGRFLETHNKDANVLEINLPTGAPTQFGWQLLPTEPNTDGFYYALLQKAPATGSMPPPRGHQP